MCKLFIYLSKISYALPTFIFFTFLLLLSFLKYYIKIGKIHSEWKLKEKFISYIEEKSNILFYIVLTLTLFWFFNCIVLYDKIDVIRDKIVESYDVIFSTLITVSGVFAGFYFNKKQTYKEIVTRERIEWLHKMQVKLANYLEPTSATIAKSNSDGATSDPNEKAKASIEDNVTVNRLYYELSFNINHNKDADALKALNNYHYARNGKPDKLKVNLALKDEVKIELVLDKGEEDELLFIIKDEKELKKLKDIISPGELEKIKIGKENENLDEEKEFEKELVLLKKDLSEEFTKIFNETWGDIKREAD